MKKSILVLGATLLAVTFCLTACGGGQKQATTEEPATTDTVTEEPAATTPEATEASAEVQDWDKILDDYETLIDQHLDLAAKAKAKDLTAVPKAAEALQNANNICEQIKVATDKLTAEQATRFATLQKKLADGIANL